MEKLMKKIIILMLVLVVFLMSCKSIDYNDYDQPDASIPNSYVIDSRSMGGNLNDRIRLYNRSTNSFISFVVYCHDPQTHEWIKFGSGMLKGPNDTHFISSSLNGKLKRYRYYAIEAEDGNEYKYSFFKNSNDLHILISN
jgi:hypothetical protein